MTREIPLTRGFVALVDSADYEWLSKFKWRASSGDRKRAYAIRVQVSKGVSTTFAMHRLIAGVGDDQVTDHINGDTLDNRRANLRACTQQQNSFNRSYPAGPSGYKGVSKDGARWRAYIVVDRKHRALGGFASPLRAALAYDDAAKNLHGEFANLNFSADRDWIFPQADAEAWALRKLEERP